MVPLELFADRVFTAANICTFAIYGALAARGSCWSSSCSTSPVTRRWRQGSSTIPATILMLLFSSKAGALGTRIGPRWPMTIGPWWLPAACC